MTEAVGADVPIVALPTATTGFVGRALRGPVNCPVRVRDYAEYQQVFGGLWQPSMLSYAVEQYFDNGGREAVIVRVVNGGAPVTISLPCGDEKLVLEALSPGTREILRASVDDHIAPSEDDRFNLVLQRVRTLGSEQIEDQEIFRRLSTAPGTTRLSPRRCRNPCWCGCVASCRMRVRTARSVRAHVTRSVHRIPTVTMARRSPITT